MQKIVFIDLMVPEFLLGSAHTGSSEHSNQPEDRKSCQAHCSARFCHFGDDPKEYICGFPCWLCRKAITKELLDSLDPLCRMVHATPWPPGQRCWAAK